jgi:hypothetical protein
MKKSIVAIKTKLCLFLFFEELKLLSIFVFHRRYKVEIQRVEVTINDFIVQSGEISKE